MDNCLFQRLIWQVERVKKNPVTDDGGFSSEDCAYSLTTKLNVCMVLSENCAFPLQYDFTITASLIAYLPHFQAQLQIYK